MKPWEVRNAAARKAWVARGRTRMPFTKFGIDAGTYSTWSASSTHATEPITLDRLYAAMQRVHERSRVTGWRVVPWESRTRP